jgi:hypothetical protein
MPESASVSISDPMGLYALLGVGPLADTTEIKAAYRYKAKLLHPDRNASPEAEKEFQDVTEAYKTLRDPKQRAAYDAQLYLPGPASLIDPADPTPQPLACSRCGQVTAQPRYIVFHRVKSSLWSARRSAIRGIFCRHCADRTAILASTTTWILGWWSFTGPYYSLRALFKNLCGGDKPAADNLWVVLHQARAFQAKGHGDIARALAEQAQSFAADDREKSAIADIAKASIAGTPRRLRNRWHPWNYATLIQAMPLAAFLAFLIVGATVLLFRTQTDSATAMISVRPAQPGDVLHVAVDTLKVREGPTGRDPVVALLDRFTTVQVVETVAEGDWARIVTPSGISGYVPSRYLFGGSIAASQNRWCSDQRGVQPGNGDVLLRRSGGHHRLTVHNGTGSDVVVRLKTAYGRTLLAFYVSARADTVIDGIPEGTFRAVFATGRNYSHACGVFLEDMRTFVAPADPKPTLASGDAKGLFLDLPAAGDGPGQSRALPADGFLDSPGS